MGNINGWDGPAPKKFFDKQVELQHKIVTRMRELGMQPIAPAFAGFVPPEFERVHPEAKLQHLKAWAQFDAPYYLEVVGTPLPDVHSEQIVAAQDVPGVAGDRARGRAGQHAPARLPFARTAHRPEVRHLALALDRHRVRTVAEAPVDRAVGDTVIKALRRGVADRVDPEPDLDEAFRCARRDFEPPQRGGPLLVLGLHLQHGAPAGLRGTRVPGREPAGRRQQAGDRGRRGEDRPADASGAQPSLSSADVNASGGTIAPPPKGLCS